LPDPQRLLRRLTRARPVSRAVTHVAVIGLVAFATAFGYVATRPPTGSTVDSASLLPFDLVARVRGADAAAATARHSTFELQPDPNRPDPMLSRRVLRTPPSALPTPVAPPPRAPDPPVAVGGVAAVPPPAAPVPAKVVGSGVLAWPVVGGSVTTYFSSAHLALDIAVPYGSTVMASDAGVVTWAGWRNNGGGLVVAIDHGNGITTLYNHLGTLAVGAGQAVAKGQAIGSVGCTGWCTGPHVHFEVVVGGVLVNPLRYL
jgi:murein DD-endopeptidase MepM/ murein hydrolase activator NlpD